MRKGIKVPNVTFKVRAEDENGAFGWTDLTTDDMFNLSGIGYDRRVAVFSLPGAFTPTCSEKQLPAYEENYEKLRSFVDEVYCISVNDSFVMNAWAKNLGIKNVKMIPDGNGSFTKQMGMLISKDHLGFGERSWRYSMVCNNGVVEKWNEEPGRNDTGADEDPYESTDPDTLLKQLGAKTFMQDIANQY